MALARVIWVVIITGLFTAVAGGLGYLIWLRTRPKKMTWKASVYQLSDGVIPAKKDKDGNIVSIELKGIKPFIMDTLEKVEKDHGVEIYRLQKLNKTTPAVTSDCVEFWGQDRRFVRVLLDGGNCTLLKNGYDKRGQLIFNPMPYERMNMVQNEMSIKKDRLKPAKDILERISPWIIAGILMLGMFAITYFTVQGFIEISSNLGDAITDFGNQYKEAAQLYKEAWTGQPTPTPSPPPNSVPPPSIT